MAKNSVHFILKGKDGYEKLSPLFERILLPVLMIVSSPQPRAADEKTQSEFEEAWKSWTCILDKKFEQLPADYIEHLKQVASIPTIRFDQVPEEDDLEMIVIANCNDLSKNRKPEGYLRKARVRIIFPMDRQEFYIQSYKDKLDLSLVAAYVKFVLDKGHIKYEFKEDDETTFDLYPKKR